MRRSILALAAAGSLAVPAAASADPEILTGIGQGGGARVVHCSQIALLYSAESSGVLVVTPTGTIRGGNPTPQGCFLGQQP